MPQYERRLYEPSDEARAFDGGDDEFNEEEGSRLPLLIVIALVVLASFAGVVWIAYTQGVQRGRENAPRLHAAQQEGTAGDKHSANPYTKLEIYKPPQPTADASTSPPGISERTATSALKTVAPPRPATKVQSASVPQARPITGLADNRGSVAPKSTAPLAKNAQTPEQPSAGPAARGLNQKPVLPAAPKPQAGPAAVSSPASRQDSGNPAASPAIKPPGSGASGGYVLQIGSYPSAAEANASWQAYKGAHASVAGYAPDIQSADLGKRGTWYRLRIGPFGSLAEASAACAKLKAQGSSCLPAKR